MTLIITSLIIFCIHLVLKFVSIVVFNEQHGFLFELSNRFDMNDENSVPQWFSQVIFLLIGVSALLAAYLQIKKAAKRLWLAIGVIGVLLSLDDVAALHEFILQSIHNTFFLDTKPTFFINAWWLILPVVLIVAGLLTWYAWRLLPRRTILLFIIGGSVFLVGKVVIDSIANNVSDLFLERGVAQGTEKVFQYIGISIFLYANLNYLEAYHSKKIQKAIAQLRRRD